MRKSILICLALAGPGAPVWGLTHTVVKGDHLWGLAGTYYKNHFRWKVIYSANQDKIKDPHWIYPGQVFVIPDVPGPEIGELGARPIETAAAVPAPAPESAPEPAGTKPAPTARPPGPRQEVEQPLKSDLSVDMPPSLTGQYPSMRRLKAPRDWREDGAITEFDGREIIAGQGDSVNAKIQGPVAIGERLVVYRRDGLQEFDEDKKAVYLQSVGEVEVKRRIGKSRYSLLILKSGDSIQLGDLLKRGEL